MTKEGRKGGREGRLREGKKEERKGGKEGRKGQTRNSETIYMSVRSGVCTVSSTRSSTRHPGSAHCVPSVSLPG